MEILAGLVRLAEVVQPGDFAMFYYSGHGCRTPQLASGLDREVDGLDEVILPADTQRWNGKIGFVQNAIRDNEIGRALRRVQSRCTTVGIFDNCFSNTATKAFSADDRQITFRAVRPSALGMPDFAVSKAMRARDLRPTPARDPNSPMGLFATPEDKQAPEVMLPGPDGVERVYGVFTWLLARTLDDPSVKTVAHLYSGARARRTLDLQAISRAVMRKTPSPILEDPWQRAASTSLTHFN